MNIKGTQTEKNLRAALEGESVARNKYTYYAMAARKAGDDKVADAFERMAKNEMMHAKFWFELLYGKPGETADSLRAAAAGEYAEWNEMYPSFAQKAREEGLDDVAIMFEKVANIERDHERQFMTMLAELSGGKNEPEPLKMLRQGYRCMFCGSVYERRPDACEVCQAIGSFEACSYEA